MASSLKMKITNGPQLREWRGRVGGSQERVGKELGVSGRSVRSWEAAQQDLPRAIQLALRGLEGPLRRRVLAEKRKEIAKLRRQLDRLQRQAPLQALRAADGLSKQIRRGERPDPEALRRLRDAQEIMTHGAQ